MPDMLLYRKSCFKANLFILISIIDNIPLANVLIFFTLRRTHKNYIMNLYNINFKSNKPFFKQTDKKKYLI